MLRKTPSFEEQHSRDQRETRKEVYFDFADAVSVHATLAQQRVRCRLIPAEDIPQFVTMEPGCPVSGAQFCATADAMRKAQVRVFVYGSEPAYRAAREVVARFPPEVMFCRDGEFIASGPGNGGWINGFDYFEQYLDFLQLMCREIPATPRQDCESSR
jgi:hypothetical protein